MGLIVIRVKEVRSCRDHGRKPQLSAQCNGFLKWGAWCQFDVEIDLRLLTPGSQGERILRQDHKPRSILGDGLREIERFVTVASGENPAEIGIAGGVLREQDGTVKVRDQFGP